MDVHISGPAVLVVLQWSLKLNAAMGITYT
jgi:hypothetical protein